MFGVHKEIDRVLSELCNKGAVLQINVHFPIIPCKMEKNGSHNMTMLYPICVIMRTSEVCYKRTVLYQSSIWTSKRETLSSWLCEQQRRRPVCTSAQSDQCHCYSLIESIISELTSCKISII